MTGYVGRVHPCLSPETWHLKMPPLKKEIPNLESHHFRVHVSFWGVYFSLLVHMALVTDISSLTNKLDVHRHMRTSKIQ